MLLHFLIFMMMTISAIGHGYSSSNDLINARIWLDSVLYTRLVPMLSWHNYCTKDKSNPCSGCSFKCITSYHHILL